MANIQELGLQRYDDGQYQKHYYQKTIYVPIGIGNESDAVRVVLANKINVHFTNGSLYESLATPEDIENDTAHWEFVADSTAPVFTLTAGATFLKLINSSGTEEALLNITGV